MSDYVYNIITNNNYMYMMNQLEVWETMYKAYTKIKKNKRLNAIKKVYKEDI